MINLQSWLEETYPINVTDIKKGAPGWLILARRDGRGQSYCLQSTELSAERLLFIQTGILHLNENGFLHAEPFTKTKEGLPYGKTDTETFILRPYYPEPGFSFDDREEFRCAIGLLARMHLAGKGFTESLARKRLEAYQLPYTVKCSLGDAPETFSRRLAELKRFQKIAAKGKSDFDYQYARMADNYCRLGETLLDQLNRSAYQALVADGRREGCLCHRDFTGHNTVNRKPLPLITNFQDLAIELPVYDVANLLRRRLRKCNWEREEALFVLKTYNEHRRLSPEESEVLKILLQFPQKLWRVVNKYYNSKRGRYEKTGLAKLSEIEQERKPLSLVVQSL